MKATMFRFAKSARTFALVAGVAASAGCMEAEADVGSGETQLGETEAAISIAAVRTAPRRVWLYQNFDSLNYGVLAGQDGWTTMSGDTYPTVVPADANGNALQSNVPPGSNLRDSVTKDVADQYFGDHVIQFQVRASYDVVDASVAKLVVNGTADGAVKAFQVYAGNSLRVNTAYGTQFLFQAGEFALGAWYDVSCTLSLGARVVTCSAGFAGQPASRYVSLGTAASTIVSVDVFGWDLPGSIQFDEILGVRI